jgi:hypothetical protein
MIYLNRILKGGGLTVPARILVGLATGRLRAEYTDNG